MTTPACDQRCTCALSEKLRAKVACLVHAKPPRSRKPRCAVCSEYKATRRVRDRAGIQHQLCGGCISTWYDRQRGGREPLIGASVVTDSETLWSKR